MDNTFNGASIKKLEMLVTVVDRNKGEFYMDVISQFDVNCQMFLQERWVYSRSKVTCNSGSPTMTSHVQVPGGQGRRMFLRQGEEVAGLSTEPTVFTG